MYIAIASGDAPHEENITAGNTSQAMPSTSVRNAAMVKNVFIGPLPGIPVREARGGTRNGSTGEDRRTLGMPILSARRGRVQRRGHPSRGFDEPWSRRDEHIAH